MNKKICYTMEDVKDFFKDFNCNRYSIDTETTGLRLDKLEITGISFCDGKNACYVPIDSSKNTSPKLYITMYELKQYLSNTLFKDDCQGKTVVMHNAPFDGKVLGKYGLYFWNAKVIFDTMVASHLIDENRESKGLKHLSKELLGVDATKFDDAGGFESHYTEKFFQYGMDDAINTWNLAVVLSKQLKEKGLMKLMLEIESDFQKVLIQMKLEGVLIDKKFLEDTTNKLKESKTIMEKELYKILDEPYSIQMGLTSGKLELKGKHNFKSSQQLSKILFEKLGLEIVERTEKGQPKTGKITINKYKNTVPFVAKLNEYKICSKLLDAFFEPMPNHIQSDGKIRPDFMDCGTKTGRLSSAHPNFQNQPNSKKDFPIETRKCFIAPDSYRMVGIDFKGQESRVIAHLSSDPKLIKLFEGDGDFHLSTANSVYKLGIPLEALSANHTDNEKFKKKFKEERSKAKTINFAVPYGAGAYSLASGMNCTEEEAQIFLDNFFSSHPGIKEAIDKACSEVKNFGFVRTELGRYRHFKQNDRGFYDSKAYRQSFNMLIQGFSSDMMRLAMNSVFNMSKKHPEWDLKAILSIHDEGIYLVKEKFANEASVEIKKCFENCIKLKTPVGADIKIGNNYADVK